MRRSLLLGIVGLVVVGALLFVLLGSNLLRSEGHVEFAPSTNGMNSMFVTGRYGYKCIEYYKIVEGDDTNGSTVSSKGMGDCSFLGAVESRSNTYPGSGSVAVPLEQHTLVYKNEDSGQEIYVLITKDASAYDRLDD